MDGKLMRYRIQPFLWFYETTKLLHKNQGTKFWPTKISYEILKASY